MLYLELSCMLSSSVNSSHRIEPDGQMSELPVGSCLHGGLKIGN